MNIVANSRRLRFQTSKEQIYEPKSPVENTKTLAFKHANSLGQRALTLSKQL